MKKNQYIYVLIIIAIISFIVYKYKFKYKEVILKENKNNTISLMYTNKDNIATYGVYNIEKDEFIKKYCRKNETFSDFIIDEKHNILYYTDLIDNKYNIYKVNLTNKKDSSGILLDSKCTGDIFDLYNDTIIFRTINSDNSNYSLGRYNLVTKEIDILNKDYTDSYLYKFYYNKFNNKIYTLERSISEMGSKRFPDIPTHKIIEYEMNTKVEKEAYSTNKFINNISINKTSDKILFDATEITDDKTSNNIYLIDLKSNDEKVVLISSYDVNNSKFTLIKNPEFSMDEKGFFFLGVTSASNQVEQRDGSNAIMSNALYYYEFVTEETHKLFEVDDAVINIFKLNY